MADHKAAATTDFDENKANAAMDRQSRAIAALGVDTFRNMGSYEILIIGQRGVGVEIAKNIILAGPKSVTVYDNDVVQIADLGTNFYLRKEHAGSVKRAAASVADLADLNPQCDVRLYEGELTTAFLQSFGCVFVTVPLPKSELLRINQACRTRASPSAFIMAITLGVTGFIFSDFGNHHVINDPDGEPTRSLVVSSVDRWGVVTTTEAHGFDDSDPIEVDGFEGEISILNNLPHVRVKRIYEKFTDKKTGKPRQKLVLNRFQLDLTAAIEAATDSGLKTKLTAMAKEAKFDWESNGTITQVKKPVVKAFKSLEEAFVDAAAETYYVPHVDQGRMSNSQGNQLLLGFHALVSFMDEHKRMPALHSTDDAKAVTAIAVAQNNSQKALMEEGKSTFTVEEVDPKLIQKLSLYSSAELTGYCAFLGGIAAQEAMKKFGKLTPLFQWITSDHFEMVSPTVPFDARPQQSRYDHQISIFGQAFQHKLSNQRWFMIGCGALGCEYIKSYALMGVGTGPKGQIFTTDMDRIELSNLSRQFLFRQKHIGKSKAVCSAAVAREMNPELKVQVYEQRVGEKSEHIFNDEFWEGLDGCWNALDNVIARKYTDRMCLRYSLPLLESGTQGTKANSEIIIPFKTTSYNDHEDQETGGIAMCTLKMFPNQPDHCIEWAKPLFAELFESGPATYNSFIEDKAKFAAQLEKLDVASRLECVETVLALAHLAAANNVEEAIKLAFKLFNNYFRDRILNLIARFPKDARDLTRTESGEVIDMGPFWSSGKRFPSAAEFSLEDSIHLQFLHCTANLLLFALGKEKDMVRTPEEFKAIAARVQLEAHPWTAASLGVDEKGNPLKEAEAMKLAQVTEIKSQLEAFAAGRTLPTLQTNEFEKDDDTNFHIDWMAAASNLRALNYKIKPSTRLQVKITAGKIIPALATTTAMIAGQVQLEFYKLVMGMHFLSADKFFNANVNMALPVFNFFEVKEAHRHDTRYVTVEGKEGQDDTKHVYKGYPSGFTSWDKIVIDKPDMSLAELREHMLAIGKGELDVMMFARFGISAEDIKEGKGKSLVVFGKPASTAMEEKQLARPNISDNLRAKFTADLARKQASNKEMLERQSAKVLEAYVSTYGELRADQRYVLLVAGADSQLPLEQFPGCSTVNAELPIIQFYVK